MVLVPAWSFSVRSVFRCPLGLLMSAESLSARSVRLVFYCLLGLSLAGWSFSVRSDFVELSTGTMVVLVRPISADGRSFLPCCYEYATTIRQA